MGEVQLGKTGEKTENKKTSGIEKVALNKQGAQNLRAASAKNPPQQKKEKKFSMSLGTTEVSSEDRTMRVSTTGLKFKTKKEQPNGQYEHQQCTNKNAPENRKQVKICSVFLSVKNSKNLLT